MPSNPLALVNEQEPEIDEEQELPATPEVSTPVRGKPGWIERAERTKPIKPEPVKPVVEPPELVSVEMTPEEQDVYALMGVSPLVRLNRTVKNPKSVIINVTLPGQLPTAGTLSETRTPDFESTVESTTAEPDRMTQQILPAPAESFRDTPGSTSPVSVITDENDANSEMPLNRRRRRRSSNNDNRTED
jgi:ribonuclease E